MSHYKHITPEEREKILLLHSQNCTITYIANSIGRDKSTISRELSRNTVDSKYSAISAQAAYEVRRKTAVLSINSRIQRFLNMFKKSFLIINGHRNRFQRD